MHPDVFECAGPMLRPAAPTLFPATGASLHRQTFEPEEMVALCDGVWWSLSRQVPPELKGKARGAWAFQEHMPNLWVRDPLTEMILPYWAPPEIVMLLADAESQTVLGFPSRYVPWLRDARILAQMPGPLHDAQALANHRHMLEREQYTVLRRLFPACVLESLCRRMRVLQRQGKLSVCTQVKKRTAIHNDPVIRYFQFQLADYLNRILVDKIKASYVYSVIYHEGAELTRHVDRPQCRWNLSLHIGSTPEVTEDTTWPIYLQVGEEKPVEVRLMPGDAVLYSGTDIPHWRDPQPSGYESIVSFFHFVPEDFASSLD